MEKGHVLRRLAQPKWLGGLVLATAFAVACFYLGQWQWSRYEARAERNATLERNYAADPVAFASAVDESGIRPGADWSRVALDGTYAPEQVYVRNRPNEGVYGYEVVGLLLTDSDGWVAVNRGWVPNSPEGAAVLPPVDPPPSGQVTVTGWVRPYERSLGRDLPDGQVASIAGADLRATTGLDLAAAYVRAQSEEVGGTALSSGLAPMEPPERGLGPHQAYAIQWWLTMALGYAFVVLGVRRELRAETAVETAGGTAAESGDTSPPRRPARVSRWDEEDS
jgi:cytochrome oxidase assembly protein ShyY1